MLGNPTHTTSKKRSRLTLGAGSASTTRHLPLTADIPQFTHASSQQSTAKVFKPLPRPIKEPPPPKVKPKPRAKASSKKSPISTVPPSLPGAALGAPKSLTKKLLEKAEAERKRKDGPLEDPEEGYYDEKGWWQESSALDEWKLGTTEVEKGGE